MLKFKFLKISFQTGSLSLAILFSTSAFAGDGSLTGVQYSSCGVNNCVFITSPKAFLSLRSILTDYVNPTFSIRSKSGEIKKFTAEDALCDREAIGLRRIAELGGRDAVYDLKTEKLTIL